MCQVFASTEPVWIQFIMGLAEKKKTLLQIIKRTKFDTGQSSPKAKIMCR